MKTNYLCKHYKHYFIGKFDRTLFYLDRLEPRIKYYSDTMWFRGLDKDDLAQELRFHLWKILSKYNPDLSKIESWGNVVIQRKIWNLTNPSKYKRDQLDANGRTRLPL